MVNKRRENGYSIPSRERETYTSKDGFEFDIYTSRWQLSVNSSLNIDWLADFLPHAQEEALRRTFAYRATQLAASTVCISVLDFKRFLSTYVDAADGISIHVILTFFASDEPKHIKSNVKVFLERCFLEGYGNAFEPGMESYLSELVIGDRGNRFNHEKSEDTRALTEYERKQFIYQLVRAHFTGKICEKTYLILKLIFITGKRAEQLANTKLCDFKNGFINIDGTPKKVILYNCPIAKQKFQTFRVEFNEIPLSWELDFDKDISAVADRSITCNCSPRWH